MQVVSGLGGVGSKTQKIVNTINNKKMESTGKNKTTISDDVEVTYY
jgi:hypothetical protein